MSGQGPAIDRIVLVNTSNTGTFCGNMAYAYELAAAYLSLRLIAAKHVNYDRVTVYMLVFIGVNYYLCAASYLLVRTYITAGLRS